MEIALTQSSLQLLSKIELYGNSLLLMLLYLVLLLCTFLFLSSELHLVTAILCIRCKNTTRFLGPLGI